MTVVVRTHHLLSRRVVHVRLWHHISPEQFRSEPIEHLVATDGNLQSTVASTHLHLHVEEPRASITAHQEHIVKSQDQTAVLRAFRHRTSMRHDPTSMNMVVRGHQLDRRFQDPFTPRRAPSPHRTLPLQYLSPQTSQRCHKSIAFIADPRAVTMIRG
jgi:hypothetical protein